MKVLDFSECRFWDILEICYFICRRNGQPKDYCREYGYDWSIQDCGDIKHLRVRVLIDIFSEARTAYLDMDSIRKLPYPYLIISLSSLCPSTRTTLKMSNSDTSSTQNALLICAWNKVIKRKGFPFLNHPTGISGKGRAEDFLAICLSVGVSVCPYICPPVHSVSVHSGFCFLPQSSFEILTSNSIYEYILM